MRMLKLHSVWISSVLYFFMFLSLHHVFTALTTLLKLDFMMICLFEHVFQSPQDPQLTWHVLRVTALSVYCTMKGMSCSSVCTRLNFLVLPSLLFAMIHFYCMIGTTPHPPTPSILWSLMFEGSKCLLSSCYDAGQVSFLNMVTDSGMVPTLKLVVFFWKIVTASAAWLIRCSICCMTNQMLDCICFLWASPPACLQAPIPSQPTTHPFTL